MSSAEDEQTPSLSPVCSPESPERCDLLTDYLKSPSSVEVGIKYEESSRLIPVSSMFFLSSQQSNLVKRSTILQDSLVTQERLGNSHETWSQDKLLKSLSSQLLLNTSQDQSSARPTNTVYSPKYESLGLDIDPHLRKFSEMMKLNTKPILQEQQQLRNSHETWSKDNLSKSFSSQSLLNASEESLSVFTRLTNTEYSPKYESLGLHIDPHLRKYSEMMKLKTVADVPSKLE